MVFKQKEQIMGKIKDFVEDFLHVVNNDLQEKYRDKNWDWSNLPHFEKMVEVLNEGKNKKRDEN